MLAFAPKGDGSFPEAQKVFIHKMGAWLKVTGEAIYATRKWDVNQDIVKNLENANVRVCYTRTKDEKVVYATFLEWVDKEVTLEGFTTETLKGKQIKKVSILVSNEKLKWKMTTEGLTFDLTGKKPDLDYAFPIKIELKK